MIHQPYTHSHKDSFCFSERWWNAVQAKCKPLLILLLRHRNFCRSGFKFPKVTFSLPFWWKKEKRHCVIVAVLRNHQSQKTKRWGGSRGGRGGLVFLVVISSLLQLPCCTAQTPAVLLQHQEKSQLRCVITCTRVCSEERHLWTWLRYSDTLPCFALPLCHSTVFTHYLWFCFPPLCAHALLFCRWLWSGCSEVFLKRSPSPPRKSRPLFSSRAASSEEYKRPILSQFSVAFLCACAGVCLCMWASAKQQEKLTTQ